MNGKIYVITNKINNKIYVGQTIQRLNARFLAHKYESKKHKYPICNAIRKYGLNNFNIKLIQDKILTQKKLDKLEIFWIKELKSHVSNGNYNIEFGGNGRGKTSEETKRKLAKINTGRKHTKATKAKMAAAKIGNQYNLGKKHSKKSKLKRSKSLMGHKVSRLTRAKISKANKGKSPRLGSKVKGSSSKYHGVSFIKNNNNWRARVYFNSAKINLGSFDNELDAAKAYNKYIIKNNFKNYKLNKC